MVASIRKLFTLLVVLALSACAAPASSTGLPPVASAPDTGIPSASTTVPPSATPVLPTSTPMSDPLSVQVLTDGSLAVSAVISPMGGTLTAQAADGTKFTLTLPEGALLSDENITLTPVTSVGSLPFSGGLVGGVQMAPEGLRLFKPAALTIESSKTAAASGFETVAFGYHQNGEGLYLNPSDAKGDVLTLEVWHFSGEAAAQGTPAEIQTQQQHVPSNSEDAFTQRMQEYLGIERQAQMIGEPDPNFQDRMSGFLREAYDSFIAPQLPIALEDCAKAPAILSRALGWARQAELRGGTDQNTFRADIAKVMETYQKFKEKCTGLYQGEGKYTLQATESGITRKNTYTFLIAFRVNPDGTILGDGLLKLEEVLYEGQGMKCSDPALSLVTFPRMKVTGTVSPGAAGVPDGTFKLTIFGPQSSTSSQFKCEAPIVGSWTLSPAPYQEFIIDGIQISAQDGAQANGTKPGETWELQIHKQETP